jgi:hypothetical protein
MKDMANEQARYWRDGSEEAMQNETIFRKARHIQIYSCMFTRADGEAEEKSELIDCLIA